MDLNSTGARQPSHRSLKKGRSSVERGGTPPQHYGMEQPGYPPPYPPQQGGFEPNFQQAAASYYGGAYGAPGQMPPQLGQSYYGGSFPQAGAQGFINDPMANMAMAYGQTLMGQGKQMVDQKLEKYVPISKLKYYFAVDTTYVRRKLTLVLFPFTNSDWAIKYNADEPVAPRYDLNAPDLYIPVMAFVTFILVAGLTLGTQNKFNPEQLGVQASSALGWLILEVVILLLTTYVMNIQTDLRYLDFLAFCSYKYVGMIVCVCSGLFFRSPGYYITLLYTSLAVSYFLVKTLRIQLTPTKSMGDHMPHGNKRRMYLLLCIAVLQPFIMFWLTHRLIPQVSAKGTGVGGDDSP